MLGFDVYVYNVTSEELVPITTDGRENEVYNSIPDWMYEGTVLTTLFIFHAVSFVQNKYASRLPILTVNTTQYVCMNYCQAFSNTYVEPAMFWCTVLIVQYDQKFTEVILFPVYRGDTDVSLCPVVGSRWK